MKTSKEAVKKKPVKQLEIKMKNKEKTDEASLINNKSKTDNAEPSSNIIAK
ncbi:hypothetical protein C5167_005503 [Papaver somniferum]|uniref:Uncharacterized protein n=1 Tax=Papaver somniferum TaxID=3469 RepID=A0A4Y7JCE5_PAPSO|nr:hypothetical protein C5167_005503 [Papaver somniferum]